MRRRRGGIGIFGFIIIMSILDAFFESGGMLIFGLIVPVVFTGLFIYGIAKFLSYAFGEGQTNRRSSNVYTNKSTSYVKNARNAQIDKVLAEYFENNVSLVLFDDVSISTQNGVYTTVDNLYVNYKEEKICQLKEFKSYYPGAYEKIINSLAQLTKKSVKQNEKKKKKDKEEKKEDVKDTKKDSFSDADKYIDQINSLNRDLINEEVTNGLYQTCDLLKQIDIVDREDGTVDPKLNKLYEYYLPILTGILEDYKRLSASPIKGDEFKKCETQLVKTIKLINEALKTIYSSMHESDYMNLNANINTLQSLLKQDGFGSTPFKEDK
ncbi:MAG: hypothetical protein IIZ64_05965 [Erysipelotrichaceae bacterium]|nr:hypothetical protein [Erysipelotrichaceae bacterium]